MKYIVVVPANADRTGEDDIKKALPHEIRYHVAEHMFTELFSQAHRFDSYRAAMLACKDWSGPIVIPVDG